MRDGNEVILVTGTRAPAALEIAWRLHGEGYRVVTADSTPARLCRGMKFVEESYEVTSPVDDGARYLEEIAEICDKWKVKMVVPICEEVFHLARGRAVLPEGCELYAPSFEVLGELHDKLRFARLVGKMSGGEVRVPRSFAGEEFVGEVGRWVAKPRYSRFGSRVRFFESGGEVVTFLSSVVAEEWMVQEMIQGEVRCSYELARDGVVLGGVVYRPLATVSGGASIAFEVVEEGEITRWVGQVVEKYGLTGQVAFDFLIDEGGQRWVIECNPRSTSGVHFLADEARLGDVILRGDCELDFMGEGSRKGLKGLSFFKNPSVALGCNDIFEKFKSVALMRNQVSGLWHFFREGRRRGCSMTEASVRDIEWNGGGE